MDLGAVIQDSQSRVDVEMITEEADANALYDEATTNLKYRAPVIRPDASRVHNAEKEQAAREYYASVRTNVKKPRPSSPCVCPLILILFVSSGIARVGSV